MKPYGFCPWFWTKLVVVINGLLPDGTVLYSFIIKIMYADKSSTRKLVIIFFQFHLLLLIFSVRWQYLRDWSRSGGSYGNNTRVICCPAPGRPESAARGTSPPDNKSRGCCCRNSRPTVINPDYNMTKQRCMKRIYDKILQNPPPNLATSPTCLHYDVTHLSLTTGVVALHIPSWRIEVHEECRQARKIVWPVNAGRVICRYQNNLCGIINHHKHIRYYFLDV